MIYLQQIEELVLNYMFQVPPKTLTFLLEVTTPVRIALEDEIYLRSGTVVSNIKMLKTSTGHNIHIVTTDSLNPIYEYKLHILKDVLEEIKKYK